MNKNNCTLIVAQSAREIKSARPRAHTANFFAAAAGERLRGGIVLIPL